MENGVFVQMAVMATIPAVATLAVGALPTNNVRSRNLAVHLVATYTEIFVFQLVIQYVPDLEVNVLVLLTSNAHQPEGVFLLILVNAVMVLVILGMFAGQILRGSKD